MSGFGSTGQPTTSPTGTAKVEYGTYREEDGAFIGMTIAQVRLARGEAWSIPSDAKAFRNRDEVGENYIVQANDEITFHRRQGDKG